MVETSILVEVDGEAPAFPIWAKRKPTKLQLLPGLPQSRMISLETLHYLSRRALLLTPKESAEEILAAVVVYDWKKGAWRLGFVPMKYAGNAWKPGKARSWKKMESAPDLSAFQRID